MLHIVMKLGAFFVAVLLAASPAMAQRADKGGKNQGMSKAERQKMREDMRDIYQDKGGQRQAQQPRQMSPEQREGLRRDMRDANQNLKKR